MMMTYFEEADFYANEGKVTIRKGFKVDFSYKGVSRKGKILGCVPGSCPSFLIESEGKKLLISLGDIEVFYPGFWQRPIILEM